MSDSEVDPSPVMGDSDLELDQEFVGDVEALGQATPGYQSPQDRSSQGTPVVRPVARADGEKRKKKKGKKKEMML